MIKSLTLGWTESEACTTRLILTKCTTLAFWTDSAMMLKDWYCIGQRDFSARHVGVGHRGIHGRSFSNASMMDDNDSMEGAGWMTK